MQSSGGLDVSSDGARAAGLPSPNVVRVNNRESERWYDYEDDNDDDGTTADVTPRRGPPSEPASSGSLTPTKPAGHHRPGRNDDAKRQALAAGGDPNDWYRHDHSGQSNGTSDETATRTGKRLSGAARDGGGGGSDDVTPLWFASDGVWYDKNANDAETIGKSSTFSPKYAPQSFCRY